MRTYDLDAANERLATIRPLLVALRDDRAIVAAAQAAIERLAEGPQGPGTIGVRDQHEAAIRDAVGRMQGAVAQLVAWDVTLRDIERGLIDFPALANGTPVWLCWQLGEGPIAWWHAADEGFAGRRPLAELPGGRGPLS